jgi:hypothetical protein
MNKEETIELDLEVTLAQYFKAVSMHPEHGGLGNKLLTIFFIS